MFADSRHRRDLKHHFRVRTGEMYENYACGAERNYTGYCSPEVDKLIDQRSMEANQESAKSLYGTSKGGWPEDGARPVIFYPHGGTCRQPWVCLLSDS